MKPRELAAEIWRRNRLLAMTGWIHVVLLAAMLVIAPFDSRTVMGVNPWIKPIKFCASITLYVWTLAWIFGHVAGARWAVRLLSGGVSLAMLTESPASGSRLRAALPPTTTRRRGSTKRPSKRWV